VTAADAAEPGSTGSWLDFLTGLIPANMLGLGARSTDDGVSLSFNVLQILVVAIAVGIAVLKVGKEAEPFLAFTRSALTVVQKVLWWIILLAPLATVGLLGNAVVSYGWDTIGSLGRFTLAIYVGLALVLGVLYPVLLRAHGLSVRQYFSGAWPAIQLAFVSRSSIGTLPVTQAVTERNLGVPRAYASFAVPLGATTKMDGCAAVYPAIAAIFVAQFFGVSLGVTDYLLIAFVSVIGSAATAGVTGATVMLTLTLSTLGLPLEGVGLLLAVDPILDMGRTATNVAGQALIPTIVAKRQGILDQEVYDAPRQGTPWLETPAREDEPVPATA
jgi:Na+/H+-dicarboxylate symporter